MAGALAVALRAGQTSLPMRLPDYNQALNALVTGSRTPRRGRLAGSTLMVAFATLPPGGSRPDTC